MKTFSRITAGILSCALLLGMTSCGAAKKNLKILDTAYAEEEYAMAISKDNEGLKAAIDQALAELTEDGTIPSIIEKYIPSGATVEKKMMSWPKSPLPRRASDPLLHFPGQSGQEDLPPSASRPSSVLIPR